MNFLQSLAGRVRDAVSVVEPPRVPFVNVFPDGGLAVQRDDGAREPAPSLTPERPPAGASPPRAASPGGRAEPTATAAPVERPSMDAPRRESPTPPEPPPFEQRTSLIERVIEQRVSPPERPERERPAIAPPPAPAREPAAVREERWLHEVHETRHHVTERRTERVVETTPAPPRSPRVVAAPVQPPIEPREPAPVQAPPSPAPLPRSPRGPAISQEAAAPRPPAASPPPVHVSIGRIVVRVQAPPEPSRSEVTRPVAPALSLEAYTAAQRRGDRR